ncbi:MAG: hypothetical protein JXR72_06145 [Proteobacteria bacterium]|nr:hypothetical protein [Pseudomonadota bacterium]
MPIELAEYNTIITFLGCMCATVQIFTGFYAGYILAKPALLTTDRILNRAHRAFGSFATTLYLMGLFNGLNTFVGAVTTGRPPLELSSVSFNVHTWISFPIVGIFVWKAWLSYFDKPKLYSKRKWLGPAMFAAWAFTWITAAISYYVRTLPTNPQHSPPSFLLPYRLMGIQIVMPFVIGGIIGWIVLKRFRTAQAQAEAKKSQEKKGASEG